VKQPNGIVSLHRERNMGNFHLPFLPGKLERRFRNRLENCGVYPILKDAITNTADSAISRVSMRFQSSWFARKKPQSVLTQKSVDAIKNSPHAASYKVICMNACRPWQRKTRNHGVAHKILGGGGFPEEYSATRAARRPSSVRDLTGITGHDGTLRYSMVPGCHDT